MKQVKDSKSHQASIPTALVPDGIVYGNAPSLERIVGKHPPSRSKRNYKFFMLNKLEAMNIN